MRRVIFLDIDGPMIPGRQYSTRMGTKRKDRKGNVVGYLFDPHSVKMVQHLTSVSGARIVFNTMHNARGIKALKADMVASGLDPSLLQDDPQTVFPTLGMKLGLALIATYSRLRAIEMWLEEHPDTDWVALDDEKIDHPRALLVGFDDGITPALVNRALELFGVADGKLPVANRSTLTLMQRKVLEYCREWHHETGAFPLTGDIGRAFNFTAMRASDILASLASKGFVRVIDAGEVRPGMNRRWGFVE